MIERPMVSAVPVSKDGRNIRRLFMWKLQVLHTALTWLSKVNLWSNTTPSDLILSESGIFAPPISTPELSTFLVCTDVPMNMESDLPGLTSKPFVRNQLFTEFKHSEFLIQSPNSPVDSMPRKIDTSSCRRHIGDAKYEMNQSRPLMEQWKLRTTLVPTPIPVELHLAALTQAIEHHPLSRFVFSEWDRKATIATPSQLHQSRPPFAPKGWRHQWCQTPRRYLMSPILTPDRRLFHHKGHLQLRATLFPNCFESDTQIDMGPFRLLMLDVAGVWQEKVSQAISTTCAGWILACNLLDHKHPSLVFFKIGVTCAILKQSGNTPVSNDRFTIVTIKGDRKISTWL